MRLSFYTVDYEYCDYLRTFDRCVSINYGSKSTRPFVGIVMTINGFEYYAPLSSPKPKHLKMRNQLDFLKIDDGKLGAINFNNMIPVPEECLYEVDTSVRDGDTESDRLYKKMLDEQMTWCNANRDIITRRAVKLYNLLITDKLRKKVKDRCCNFVEDQEYCKNYTKEKA